MTVESGQPLDLLSSPVRRRIVDLLANLPSDADAKPGTSGLTAAELGAELELHTTTARFHLDQLEAGGLVESFLRRGGVGRPRKVYRIPLRSLPRQRSDDAHGTDRHAAAMHSLTALLTATWQASPDGVPLTPEQAGRQWAHAHTAQADTEAPQAHSPGAWLGKVGRTVDLLTGWGYQPEIRTQDGGRTAELTLVDCPFLELAQAHPDVVCGVHRGLLRGALESVGEPDTEVGLVPLVTPRMCLATIRTRADFRTPGLPLEASADGE